MSGRLWAKPNGRHCHIKMDNRSLVRPPQSKKKKKNSQSEEDSAQIFFKFQKLRKFLGIFLFLTILFWGVKHQKRGHQKRTLRKFFRVKRLRKFLGGFFFLHGYGVGKADLRVVYPGKLRTFKFKTSSLEVFRLTA
jgi:hypothetical protein